jgi:hypothetical protein
MKITGHLIAVLAMSTALAGCVSSGNKVVSRAGNSPADRVDTADAGNAGKALADGKTLKSAARTTSAWQRNFQGESATLIAQPKATLVRNAAGGVDLTVGTRTIHFADTDLTADGYGYELADGSAGVGVRRADSVTEALDPVTGRPAVILDYWFDDEDHNGGVNGFAIFGTETKNSVVASLASATYKGDAEIKFAPKAGFDDYGSKVSKIQGDVDMTANFGSGTVAGSITALQYQAPRLIDPTRSWTDIDGSLALNTAKIDGNGFTGAVTADAAFVENAGKVDSSSSYSGTFYGENADYAAGVLNLSGTSTADDAPTIGTGFWQGFKQ